MLYVCLYKKVALLHFESTNILINYCQKKKNCNNATQNVQLMQKVKSEHFYDFIF